MMEKITFVNENAPYVSAENLNQMQDNVENAINGIVERGSNANGEYIKFSNGTMICTKRLAGQASLILWYAPIVYADIPCGNFPQTFTAIQSIQATSENDQVVAHSISNFTTTSAGTIRSLVGVE